MYKQPLFQAILLLFLVSCTGSQAIQSISTDVPSNTTDLTEPPVPTGLPDSFQTIMPTKDPSPMYNHPVEIYNPPIEMRCPDTEIPLSALGIDATSRLIITRNDKDNIGSWQLLDTATTTTHVFTNFAESEKEVNYWISPNKNWLAIRIRSSDSKYSLWLSSIDGKERKQLLTEVEYTTTFRWINNNTLVAIDDGLSGPFMLIYPFEQTATQYIDLVVLDIPFSLFAFSPDASKLIHFESHSHPVPQWTLHDYTTQGNNKAFPAVNTNTIELPSDAWLNWKSDNLSLALVSENSIELFLNVPPQELKNKIFPDLKVVFPDNSFWIFIDWWSTDSQFIAFRRIFSLDRTGPAKFYILNTNITAQGSEKSEQVA
jgi:hypothetical protein